MIYKENLFLKLSALTILSFQLYSCASSSFKSNATLEQRKTIAIVYGQGGGVSTFISGMVLPVGTKKDIKMITLDGEKVKKLKDAKYREYRIKAGEHEIEVKCIVQLDSRTFYGNAIIKQKLLVGREYLLDAVIPKDSLNSCEPIIRINKLM